MNIADLVCQRALQQPTAPAFIDGERTVSYAHLERAIRATAAGLAERGVGEGSVVAMQCNSAITHLIVALGVAKLRAMSMPVPEVQEPDDGQALMRRFGAGFVVSESPLRGFGGFTHIAADARLLATAVPAGGSLAGPDAGDLPWRLNWSSGTTGLPKAIVYTHARSIAHAVAQPALMPFGVHTRLYLGIGIKISFAINHSLRLLLAGGTLVCHARKVQDTFELCERHGVTHIITSSAIASSLVEKLESDTPRLPEVQLYLGGGALSQRQRRVLEKRFTPQIGVIYGATEAGMVAVADPPLLARYPGTAGQVLPWIQMEAVDDADAPLPPGAMGRLRYRGLGVIGHYTDDPRATAQFFQNGWFYPGDIGHVTLDGLVYVQGRSAEVINVGGVKLAPAVIEDALLEHPAVADAAAFALSDDDGRLWLAAVVVVRDSFDRAALDRHCKARLGPNAPAVLVPVPAIPRDGLGKIARRELSRRFVVTARTRRRGPEGDSAA